MFGKKYDTATTDEITSELTAGCGRAATDDELNNLAERFSCKPITLDEDAFISGYLAGLQFGSVPSDKETFGFDAFDYEENAFRWFVHDKMKDELRKVNTILSTILGDDDGE